MRLTHEDFEHVTVLKVQGDLGADDISTFRKLVEDRMAKNARDFVIDMTGIDTIDSQGLEALLWLQELCGDRLGQMRLAGLSANTLKILEVTRLLPRLDRHADVDSAVKSLRM